MTLRNSHINLKFQAGIPITSPKFYASITEKDVKEIFASSSSSEIPLIEHRVRNLHESGRILNEKFGGSFANCIRQCNQSALQLLKLITTEFTSFRDEGLIQGKRVSFYKRAQILVGDIWGLFRGDGLGKFHDIDSLTMFADYRSLLCLIAGVSFFIVDLISLGFPNH